MFGSSVQIFRLLGFPIKVDASWILIFLLITWSLATGWFPVQAPGLGPSTYWLLGAIGSLGLFASILLHEVSHAVVARRRGLPTRGITLFLFGGVAETTEEPADATTELLVALAGPGASIVIAGGFALGARIASAVVGEGSAVALLDYLAIINLVLVAFNLVPAFPLDGGRVFRALLWRWRGDLRWATRIASMAGSLFGALLIALGVLQILGGNFVGGMWMGLIGLFLRGAAGASYRQLEIRQMLEGEPVSRFAHAPVVTVPPDVTVGALVEDWIYRHHHKLYPVLEGDRLLGCVTTRHVRGVPRENWERVRVSDLYEPCSPENSIAPEVDAVEALSRMRRTGSSRLMVVTRDGRLQGVLTLKDLLDFLELKLELESAGSR